MKTLLIDATNIRTGGGVTHLMEILRSANPSNFGFSRVVVWSVNNTLLQLEDREWLVKRSAPALEKGYVYRMLWQYTKLADIAKSENCDVIFIPGGTVITGFKPVVTMSQNLLPFEWKELFRFGVSITSLRLIALRWTQSNSFKNAQGTIFLTQYAKNIVQNITGALPGKTSIIPHGIDQRFFKSPRTQKSIDTYSKEYPFRLLYVSIINTYKHQWHLAEAVAELYAQGFPIVLELIGPAYAPALQRLQQTLKRIDPNGECIRYLGEVPYHDLHNHYISADLNVFASSCENLPNILLEAMAAGLPIACAKRGPMPEALGDAGLYFNPEEPSSIVDAIRQLLIFPELRERLAHAAYDRALKYTWTKCADQTFDFLDQVCKNAERNK